MLSTAIALLAIAAPQQRLPSLTGTIKHHKDFDSKVLGNKRNLAVYLPPGYEQDTRLRYPVLYMNDGQNVFDGMTSYIPNMEWQADEAAERLIRAGKIEPIIIVAVDNGQMARADEYLPTKAQTRFAKDPIGGKADLYGDFLVKEVMPMINQTYRTKTGALNTGLLGSSFGGVVTYHLGTTRPDVFSKLGVVSPSVWWDDRVLIRQTKAWKRKPNVRIWLDMGTKEGYQGLKDVRDLKDALVEKGFVLGKEAYTVDAGAVHNEASWAKRMERILLFLYGKSVTHRSR
jgi:predicted alpha/beta superfamily hydrolase